MNHEEHEERKEAREVAHDMRKEAREERHEAREVAHEVRKEERAEERAERKEAREVAHEVRKEERAADRETRKEARSEGRAERKVDHEVRKEARAEEREERKEARAEDRAERKEAREERHEAKEGAPRHAAHAKGAKGEPPTKAPVAKDSDKKVASAAAAKQERIPSIPKKKRPVGAIIGGLVGALVVVVAVFFGITAFQSSGEVADSGNSETLTFSDVGYNDAGELINPVDWDYWQNLNPDVYAWLQVEDTNVDYPILQHPVVDDYYLMRNAEGQPEVNGTLYTQLSYNTKDFEEDPVTVIYGHTFESKDTMFTTLHNFEDPTFFEDHPYFYIFTPDDRLKYEVVSAFEYDNKHLLYQKDMDDPETRAALFDLVQDPDSLNASNERVRKLDEKLDPQTNKILILSTCTQPADDGKRYLVCAVLRDVEPTEDVEINTVQSESHVLTDEEIAQMRAEMGKDTSTEEAAPEEAAE